MNFNFYLANHICDGGLGWLAGHHIKSGGGGVWVALQVKSILSFLFHV